MRNRKKHPGFLFISIAVLPALIFLNACSTVRQKTGIESSHNIATSTAQRVPAEMNLLHSGKVMVVLAFGQSNSANFGETRYKPKHEAYSYFRGDLFRAEDPLPGADGDRGSVWTRFADMVIESGMYDRVVFITIGIGATPVQCWNDGECSEYLRGTLEDLKSNDIRLTHILWHQGEQDNLQGTGHAEYTVRMNRLLSMIREYGQDAPMFVSLASYHPHDFKRSYTSSEVRRGQVDFINSNRGVLLGPDTDSLVSKKFRYDGVHFSSAGLDAFAGLWLKAVMNNSESAR